MNITMRIVHLLNEASNVGNGIVNVAVDIACVQKRQGHDVIVASGGGSYESFLLGEHIQHVLISQRRRPMPMIRALRRLRRLIRDFDPHIIHAHMMTGVVLARAARLSAHYALVSTVHCEFSPSSMLMGLADRVIVVSPSGAALMRRRGVVGSKLTLVQNGPLGSPRLELMAQREPVPLRRPSIVTVAGLYKRKGIAELIRAFGEVAGEFPNAHLYIVGEGPDRFAFEQLASSQCGADRIHFEGFQRFPMDYMRAADVFVLASHSESSPLVVVEARAAGAAIIGTAVNGIPELLDGGRAGSLVAPGDVRALAGEIRSLLSDSKLREVLRSRGASNLERFRIERVCSEIDQVYRSAMALRAKGVVLHHNVEAAEK
jgi:glycosyltransferase involved in cell wall biosynthesis